MVRYLQWNRLDRFHLAIFIVPSSGSNALSNSAHTNKSFKSIMTFSRPCWFYAFVYCMQPMRSNSDRSFFPNLKIFKPHMDNSSLFGAPGLARTQSSTSCFKSFQIFEALASSPNNSLPPNTEHRRQAKSFSLQCRCKSSAFSCIDQAWKRYIVRISAAATPHFRQHDENRSVTRSDIFALHITTHFLQHILQNEFAEDWVFDIVVENKLA